MDSETNDQPLNPRRREAHPEVIVVGGFTYERNDITAKKYGESERSLNRRDRPFERSLRSDMASRTGTWLRGRWSSGLRKV
jgi:hypothetical protein